MQRDYWYTAARVASELDARCRSRAHRRRAHGAPAERAQARHARLPGAVRGARSRRSDRQLRARGVGRQPVPQGVVPARLAGQAGVLAASCRSARSRIFRAPAAARRSTAKVSPPRRATSFATACVRRLFPRQLFGAQARHDNDRQRRRQRTTSSSRTATTTSPRCCKRMGRGLLVTEQLGHGVNPVTGDYSRGAAGFWVENGEIAYPVEEITIAGNLQGHVPRHRRRRQRRRPARLASCRLDSRRPHDGRRTASDDSVACHGAPTAAHDRADRSHWVRSFNDPLRSANAGVALDRVAFAVGSAGDPEGSARAHRGLPREPQGRCRPGRRKRCSRSTRGSSRCSPQLTRSTRRTTRRAPTSSRGCGTRCSTSSRRSSSRTTRRSRPAIARADNKRWRAVLPWVLVRLAHYKGLDGKFRLFRYGHWIPAQWREFHELYEFARMRGWQREQLIYGAGAFARPGVSFEQEYLKALLLMRLDSGNFTPDQVEWVSRQLDDWTPSLTLVPPPGEGAGFYVDLTGTAGPAPPRQAERPAAACCCSTPDPPTRASSSGCAGCRSRTTRSPKPGELPRARAAAAADAPRVAARPRRDRACAARQRGSAATARCASSSGCRR